MIGKCIVLLVILLAALPACKTERPVEQKKQEPPVIIKKKINVLTPEQRSTLGFPNDILSQIELAAGADAEPFFTVEIVPSENMKGEKGFERERLAGFSVHTAKADDLITTFRAGLRKRGYLIFRTLKSYNRTNDVITVVRGRNSYDLLKMQGTEGQNYHLDTKAIIAWLKERQKEGEFVITGAGPDWLDARFLKPPKNMKTFARKVVAFAPDVLDHGPETLDKLVERMNRMNGFFLVWD